jgi:DNA-binding NtrC family response regulator
MNKKMDDYRPTVLVVDIDSTVIDLFRSTLKRHNYKFFSADSYENALDFLDVKKLDLLIVELTLGEEGREGLSLAIKAKEIDKNIQIIMMTEKPDLNSINDAASIDVYDYLQKPIQIAGISRSSSRAVEKRLLLDERDTLKNYVDEINSKLRASEERYLRFTKEFKDGRFEVEGKLEAGMNELKKAVKNIKDPGVEDDKTDVKR